MIVILLLLCAELTPKEESLTASVLELAWIAGEWEQEAENGARTSEYWSQPDQKRMVGVHHDVFASGKSFFEFLRIEQDQAGITYWASPGGSAPTPFKLASHTSGKEPSAVFENAEHDWPQRLIYQRKGETLTVTARGLSDTQRIATWTWILACDKD